MGIVKTEALIIRMMDYLESSKIVTCYAPDCGKVSLIAKGARRAKSRIGGALDILQHVAIVFYQKETRELQTLSQAEIIHSFQVFQQDLQKFSYGLAIAEILEKLEIADEPNAFLFRHAVESLHGLEKTKMPELNLYHFIWRWLETSGFRPKFRRCLRCGQVPDQNRKVNFLVNQGGYICSNCGEIEESRIEISVRTIKLLLYMREHNAIRVANLNVPETMLSELRQLSWQFLHYHLESNWGLKSLDFLKRLYGKDYEIETERSNIDETETRP